MRPAGALAAGAAAPVKGAEPEDVEEAPPAPAALGVPAMAMVGIEPLAEIELTNSDGQASVGEGALERVMVLSGTAVGQAVPQGAVTVVFDQRELIVGSMYSPWPGTRRPATRVQR